MTPGAAGGRPPVLSPRARDALGFVALVVGVAAVVPPLGSWARHSLVADALQASVLALVVPALLALGAPWGHLGLAGGSGPADRVAEARRRHPQLVRSLGFVVVDLAVIVWWRTPAAVDGVVRRGWLVVPEALSLVVAGLALWLECVESPPLRPRLAAPRRALIAALAMWGVWTFAYVVGLSHVAWYRGFPHVAGRGLSAAADQQLATAVLWAVAAAVFLPVIFWNLVGWLRAEEDPDDELAALIRSERRARPARPSAPPGTRGTPPDG